MVEKTPHTEETAKQAPVSIIDTILLPESLDYSDAERLTAKLKIVVQDPDLNLALGGYLQQLIIPGMVGQQRLTGDQAQAIYTAGLETFKQIAERVLTPEQQEEAKKRGEHEVWAAAQGRREISDFARL